MGMTSKNGWMMVGVATVIMSAHGVVTTLEHRIRDVSIETVDVNATVPVGGKIEMSPISGTKLDGLRARTDRRIAEIRATPNMPIPEKANCRYLSERTGDDANDGRTPQTAWKTIARLNREPLPRGSFVLFERGGLYRGGVEARPHVTYTAYGEGPKPRIYGSPENGADPAKWERTENPRVWAYSIGHADVGTLVFDGGAAHAVKVTFRTDRKTGAKTNMVTGRPFRSYRDLDEDRHFWHDYYTNGTGKVYLYSEKNPGERYGSIEFNVKTSGFRVQAHPGITIDNIEVRHVGVHGVSAGGVTRNLMVRNCEFAWIGGSIQSEGMLGREFPTRLGNAVEICGGCEDYTVENCYIWQCYDAGITHQYPLDRADIERSHKRVRYANNVIEKCCYSIEYFLHGAKFPENPSRMEDILIENNLMWDAATGFCQQRRPDTKGGAHIKSWCNGANRATRFLVRNNLCAFSRNELLEMSSGLPNPDGSDSMPTLEGNTFIGYKGQIFGVLNYGKPIWLKYDDSLAGKLDARHTGNLFYIAR